jgi:hypothetical protein
LDTESVGDEFIAFDVFVEFTIAENKTEGMSHFMQDGGEEIVFSVGGAVGGGLEVVVYSGEFGVVTGGGVDEPAYRVGVVVEGYGGTVGGAVGVVAGDSGFC